MKTYFSDIANLLTENYGLQVPENGPAVSDMMEIRAKLKEMQHDGRNIPAGMNPASSHINAAIQELNHAIAEVYKYDASGRRWGG